MYKRSNKVVVVSGDFSPGAKGGIGYFWQSRSRSVCFGASNKPRNQLKLSRKIFNLRVSILHYSDFFRYKDH